LVSGGGRGVPVGAQGVPGEALVSFGRPLGGPWGLRAGSRGPRRGPGVFFRVPGARAHFSGGSFAPPGGASLNLWCSRESRFRAPFRRKIIKNHRKYVCFQRNVFFWGGAPGTPKTGRRTRGLAISRGGARPSRGAIGAPPRIHRGAKKGRHRLTKWGLETAIFKMCCFP